MPNIMKRILEKLGSMNKTEKKKREKKGNLQASMSPDGTFDSSQLMGPFLHAQ